MNIKDLASEMREVAEKEPINIFEMVAELRLPDEKFKKRFEYKGFHIQATFTTMRLHGKVFRQLSISENGKPPPSDVAKEVAVNFFEIDKGLHELPPTVLAISRQYLQIEKEIK